MAVDKFMAAAQLSALLANFNKQFVAFDPGAAATNAGFEASAQSAIQGRAEELAAKEAEKKKKGGLGGLLGTVGGAIAAPFTGGASLAIGQAAGGALDSAIAGDFAGAATGAATAATGVIDHKKAAAGNPVNTPVKTPGGKEQLVYDPATGQWVPISQVQSTGHALTLTGSFRTGTTSVPQDGLAMVHQGEAIIPAEMNPNAQPPGVTGAPLIGAALGAGLQTFMNNKQVKAAQTPRPTVTVAGGTPTAGVGMMSMGGRQMGPMSPEDFKMISKAGGFGGAMGQGIAASNLNTTLTAGQARQVGGKFASQARSQGQVAPGFVQNFLPQFVSAIPSMVGNAGSLVPRKDGSFDLFA